MNVYPEVKDFVNRKCAELNIELDDIDKDNLASIYYKLASDHDLTYLDDEMFNDDVFNEAYQVLLEEMKNPVVDDEFKNAYNDDDLRFDTGFDKKINSNNGYGFNDNYDDLGLDERSDDGSMKL